MDTTVTGSPDSVGAKSAKAARQLTPDAALANQSKNQTDYERNGNAELQQRQERDTLDAALSNGKVYVDAKGKITPFSTMKQPAGLDADGNAVQGTKPLSPEDVNAMKEEMRQRRAVAQAGTPP